MRITISILYIFIFIQFGCTPRFTQPELVSISRFQVRELNFEGMKLNFCTGIRNMNRYKIAIQSMEAEVYISERYLGTIRTESSLVLSKNGVSDMPLNLQVNFKGVIQNVLPLIEAFKGNSLIEIRLKGMLRARVKGISREFPFNYQDRIRPSELN